jgi:hypothetical protein
VTSKLERLADIAHLREELGRLRDEAGISPKLVDWHGRLVACLAVTSEEFPGCAYECKELTAIDFELPPEIEAKLPEGLEHRIMPEASRMNFKKRCGYADEVLNTLILALKQSNA